MRATRHTRGPHWFELRSAPDPGGMMSPDEAATTQDAVATGTDDGRSGTPPRLRDSTAPGLPVFLSTEHWSLLGTRSMTWSEVMSRITIYLTVVSAFLVVLVLTVQKT